LNSTGQKTAGFVQTLRNPGKSWNFIVQNSRPGSHGKRHRSWKTTEISGKSWNSKATLLDFLFQF